MKLVYNLMSNISSDGKVGKYIISDKRQKKLFILFYIIWFITLIFYDYWQSTFWSFYATFNGIKFLFNINVPLIIYNPL